MTRFARAKGSKASNERLPNEATPWYIMKQQLEDNVSAKNHQPEKAKSAKQLLKDKDDPFYYDTTGNVNNDWAEFERPKTQTPAKQMTKSKVESKSPASIKKNKKKLESSALENGTSAAADLSGSNGSVTPKNILKKRRSDTLDKSVEAAADMETVGVNGTEPDSTVTPKVKSRKSIANNSSVGSKAAIEVVKSAEDNSTETDGSVSLKKKSKKRKSDALGEEVAQPEAVNSATIEKTDEAGSEPKKKKKKKNRSKEKKSDSSAKRMEAESATVAETTGGKAENESGKVETRNETSEKMSKRQKRNQKRKNKIASNEAITDGKANGEKAAAPVSGGFDAAGNDWSSNVNFGKQQRPEKKSNGPSNGDQGPEGDISKRPPNRFNSSRDNNATVKRKAPKVRDDKEHKRRKPDTGSIKCTINGMDVEIVKYDGFPVKKEDAKRLKDLRQQMILKGIPRSEIDAAMKLERRKAEKALTRVRKQVCFHCRKAGHNLSDCPELGEGESATGICFKCGSTEHTHFECKVTKKQEYGFASCFICREQGHIAKQCPDNPRGLYPQGGACMICGDVTHLRKDCPDATKEKEESAMTLSTIAENTLESLDEDVTTRKAGSGGGDDGNRTKGKVVKF